MNLAFKSNIDNSCIDASVARISAIRGSGLLSGSGRQHFSLLTDHVRVALGVPVAIISAVDENRQVFAGHSGLPEPWASAGETPLTHSFCQHVVESGKPLVIADATADELVRENLAVGELGVVAYLGVPITLPTGELVGALAAIDTKAHAWSERDQSTLTTLARVVEREIAIGVSELKYRRLFDGMQEGFYIASAVRNATGELVDMHIEEINPAFEALTHLRKQQVIGARLSQIAPAALQDMLAAYRRALLTDEMIFHANAEPSNGRWYEHKIRRLDKDRVSSLFTDVTHRKAEEEQAELLKREMGHRLKNTLSIVQAIATQSLRSVADRQHIDVFEKRLQNLGSAHDILFKKNWQSATVEALVFNAFELIGMPQRAVWEGPPLEIGPRPAMALSLLLHELATNAVKYGSLSNDTGIVTISWNIKGVGTEAQFVFDWREKGGPPVAQPTAKGFGSKLIKMGLAGTGTVDISYDPAGLNVRLSSGVLQLLGV